MKLIGANGLETAYWQEFGLLKSAAVFASDGLAGVFNPLPTPLHDLDRRNELIKTLEIRLVGAFFHSTLSDVELAQLDAFDVLSSTEKLQPAAPVPIQDVASLAKLAAECIPLLECVAKWDMWRVANPFVNQSYSLEAASRYDPSSLVSQLWQFMRSLELKEIPARPAAQPTAQMAVAALDAVLSCCEHNRTLVPTPPKRERKRRDVKGKEINGKMLAAVADNFERVGWKAKEWSTHLGCAASTVVETKAWKQFRNIGQANVAANAQDRHRR